MIDPARPNEERIGEAIDERLERGRDLLALSERDEKAFGAARDRPRLMQERSGVPATRMDEVVQGFEIALRAIDGAQRDLEPLDNFIHPGGGYAGAFLHQARTIARRAERLLVSLAQSEEISPALQSFVNRLSDALFVWSRWINHAQGTPEALWNASTKPPSP